MSHHENVVNLSPGAEPEDRAQEVFIMAMIIPSIDDSPEVVAYFERHNYMEELFDRLARLQGRPVSSFDRKNLRTMSWLLDDYMGFTRLFSDGTSISFDSLVDRIAPSYELPYYPIFLDYIERYGDLRVKSWYMSVAPRRSEQGGGELL